MFKTNIELMCYKYEHDLFRSLHYMTIYSKINTENNQFMRTIDQSLNLPSCNETDPYSDQVFQRKIHTRT